ncbi:MAG: beta-N-acetylglucosaminidase domain-containing protein, partial [Bacteroidales bacterium]
MNKITRLTIGASLFCSLSMYAQVDKTSLYPLPQNIVDYNKVTSLNKPWKLEGAKNGISVIDDLQAYFAMDNSVKDRKIILTGLPKKDKLASVSGAYKLKITDKEIKIEANTDQGYFYAIQTMAQMIRMNNGVAELPQCEISDYPNVAYRGTVEGFYGEPWSHQDRIEQLKFYGKLKLNTYIYGPKDDPYHSSPNWRKPYPEAEAKQIEELAKVAADNHVDFVWAIHPGKDIQWNKEDSLAIINKFEMMYQLGVRSFAVFFDDISGAGVNAEKQAALLNYIQTEFLDKKKDGTPLIMCPTEYNKSWSNPKPGTYLDILGDNLHPNVQVMWTGNTVVDDITLEGLEWVNKRIKRPAYVWWNFPVSDYVRDHLLMGPSYGLDTKAQNSMSGFVSNPMDKAEASKVAIFNVANYSWNMENYDPVTSWKQACEYIMPEASEAFL